MTLYRLLTGAVLLHLDATRFVFYRLRRYYVFQDLDVKFSAPYTDTVSFQSYTETVLFQSYTETVSFQSYTETVLF